ncbi:MAG: chloride channel protein [Candidatus Omnitrophica bacterium]|nr:chloride channel protein [Candidatus Omnitrophota bacterium]
MRIIKSLNSASGAIPYYIGKLQGRSRLIVMTCVYGLAAGVAAVAFQSTINALFWLVYGQLAKITAMWFLVGSFAVIMATSLVSGFLLNSFSPEAAGSGIPQLKLAFWKDFGEVPWRVVWVKYIAGILSIAGGSSLGREGPTVQFGGRLASNSLLPALLVGVLVSQAISHRFTKHSFYDALLDQDGHNIEHVIPPRDLRTCQQLPISSIANFQPVVLSSLKADEVSKTFRSCPYQRLPVVQNGSVLGILLRKEAELALRQNRPPVPEPATFCLPTQTIRELEVLLIDSGASLALVLDRPRGRLLGIVTLHDLLRAEVSIAQGTHR